MMAEANGDFQTAIENLLIEAGHSIEFLHAKQAMRRKQETQVRATTPQEDVGVEKKESSQQLIQRLADERATVDNVDEEEESSHGDTTNLQE